MTTTSSVTVSSTAQLSCRSFRLSRASPAEPGLITSTCQIVAPSGSACGHKARYRRRPRRNAPAWRCADALFAARLPGRRVDQQQPFGAKFQVAPVRRAARNPTKSGSIPAAPGRVIRPPRGTLPHGRLDDVRPPLPQPRHDLVGKPIFERCSRQAQQFVDIAHRLQGEVEPHKVAVQV